MWQRSPLLLSRTVIRRGQRESREVQGSCWSPLSWTAAIQETLTGCRCVNNLGEKETSRYFNQTIKTLIKVEPLLMDFNEVSQKIRSIFWKSLIDFLFNALSTGFSFPSSSTKGLPCLNPYKSAINLNNGSNWKVLATHNRRATRSILIGCQAVIASSCSSLWQRYCAVHDKIKMTETQRKSHFALARNKYQHRQLVCISLNLFYSDSLSAEIRCVV